MIKDFFTRCDTKPWQLYLVFAGIAFFILLIFSSETCICTPYFHGDSSVYTLIGKGWSCGNLIPYRDFFDHKGPFVYAFYALAAATDQIKLALTLLQTLWLTVSLVFVYHLSRIYLSPNQSGFIVGIFLLIFIAFIEGGGNTEELSLPFSLFSLYFIVKNLRNSFSFSLRKGFTILQLLLIGAVIGILILTRPNNAVTPCVCCLILALYMMIHHRWIHFFTVTAIICMGFVLIVIPVLAYFYSQSALADYWYCNVIFNTKYASAVHPAYGEVKQFLRLPYILLLPLCVWQYNKLGIKSGWEIALLLSLAFFSFICVCMGKCFPHYNLLSLPACVYTAILTLSLLQRVSSSFRRLLTFILLLLLFIFTATGTIKRNSLAIKVHTLSLQNKLHIPTIAIDEVHEPTYREINELAHLIPDEEKGDFLCYNTFGTEYLYLNAYPCCRFFMLQDFLMKQDHDIKAIISEEFNRHTPKWILVKDPGSTMQVRNQNGIVPWERYELRAQTSLYQLYRLK